MKLGIFFHDNCFDGLSSASLFLAFAKQNIHQDPELVFGGLNHSPADISDEKPESGALFAKRLEGDINVVVDFRYLPHDRLHWWFDHHVTAFSSEEDRLHFDNDLSGRKYYDPLAPSCAGFMASTLSEKFEFDISGFSELIQWADVIDSARFPSPKVAVELSDPALRLMTWIENSKDFKERCSLIPRLVQEPLSDIAATPFVVSGLEPIIERHWQTVEAIRSRYSMEGKVFWCDLTDRHTDAVNKFIPYYIHPDARYVVIVSRASTRTKISVGYNPWAPPLEREHDISAICRKYGGGGHPVVGAVSFSPDESERALEAGREIVEILGSDPE